MVDLVSKHVLSFTYLVDPHFLLYFSGSALCFRGSLGVLRQCFGAPNWLEQRYNGPGETRTLRSLPRMCARRFSPSKQRASRRPFPSILMTWAYSGRGEHAIRRVERLESSGKGVVKIPCPSSLKVSSRFSLSFSFFPRRRFLPPWT